jgi:hypothetical protein
MRQVDDSGATAGYELADTSWLKNAGHDGGGAPVAGGRKREHPRRMDRKGIREPSVVSGQAARGASLRRELVD